MQVADARRGADGGLDFRKGEFFGNSLEQNVPRLFQNPKGSGENQKSDENRNGRIEPEEAPELNDDSTRHHADGAQQIPQNMQPGGFEIQTFMPVAFQKIGHINIAEETNGGKTQKWNGLDGVRILKTIPGFPQNQTGND